MYKVYILYSEILEKYYVGSTSDLEDRLHRHNTGQGKFTKSGVPSRLVWYYDCTTRSEAIKLEKKIKKRGIERYLSDKQFGA